MSVHPARMLVFLFGLLLCLTSLTATAGTKPHATRKTPVEKKTGHHKTANKASSNKKSHVAAKAHRQVAHAGQHTAKSANAKLSKMTRVSPGRKTRLTSHTLSRTARITRVSTLPSTLNEEPSLYSSAALVVNELSGERIYEKNAKSIVPIASITKLMTAMVALDMHLSLDEPVTITEDDVDLLKNTRSRLLVGTTLSRGEIMHLALMSSENRAAHALARTAPGGLDAFIARMNRTALALGMKNTRFLDPTGLNHNNVSTANDLVVLVQAAHQYPEIHAYSTSEEYAFTSNVTGTESQFRNTNPLVKSESWDIGISKTGYISEAGKCLVMQATINSTPVVIVLLDSAGKRTRVGDANRIKKWLETNPFAKLRAG